MPLGGFTEPNLGELRGDWVFGDDEEGSVENRRRRPVTACETVVGTLQELDREVGVLVPVFVPEPDDVGPSWGTFLVGILAMLRIFSHRLRYLARSRGNLY